MNSFDTLGLSPELLKAVRDKGYTTPTPIQREAIPVVLEGRDVMGGAQTGTGKTAGFALPLLQRLMGGRHNPAHRPVRALILTPTRELAAQVHESVIAYGRHLPFKSSVVFGGVSMGNQIHAFRKGVDIVVATPGRLLDHLRQRTLKLHAVEILVLDEADRMLDMGFLPDIKRILSQLPKNRQNLLFSATFPNEIERLCQGLLNNPKRISVARKNTAAEGVQQVAVAVEQADKKDLLSHLIRSRQWYQVLVFTRTKARANQLTKKLVRDDINAVAIHGNKSQAQRTRALAGFKSGDIQVLVATDIAARGLDIDQLPHVVNFDLPHVPEDYIHRIGRTGRAGREGEAISLVCPEERGHLRNIERLLKKNITRVRVDGVRPGPGAHTVDHQPHPNKQKHRRRNKPHYRDKNNPQHPRNKDKQEQQPPEAGKQQAQVQRHRWGKWKQRFKPKKKFGFRG